ncbi:MAG: hypothetical protein J07HQW1_00359 [Haloquadratum walsbyi J07HQW1]|jgi:predicted Rossmann fold nucleotide-binding protein DprA/Smf involved in DNA uptake|uniref:Uncharacterized protein n=1 Tax=Haloquadratum walsbyi J07HQW1 TaxID=1238424 RepID=U1N1J9_9EURY|nr:MAG: hypothetical protein J07HQW1_00359 [Haloquadratum walsbyi J07HQW1]
MSSQSTLSDDDLFGEAAEEMREEVETHLDNAQTALPDATSVWQTNADNVLGALNGLRSALDADDAEEHLRQAKKTFVVGTRADAFDDPDELRSEVESVEELLTSINTADELASELTTTVPQLHDQLPEADEETEES